MTEEQQKKCGHCWHPTGVKIPDKPESYQQVCCYCKFTRLRTIQAQAPDAGHGPYKPKRSA